MNEEVEQISLESVEHEGERYVRLIPSDIDISEMTEIHKITDVIAGQVVRGSVKIVTRHGKEVETINTATPGDWVVYDVDTSEFNDIPNKLLNCEKKAITQSNFPYLYQRSSDLISISPENIIKLTQDIIIDNIDNSEFNDTSFLHNLRRYTYVGKPVYAYQVPFNFVIKAPWSQDQFIKRGGYIIHDTNLTPEERGEMYGMEGVSNRTPGVLERTFALSDGKGKRPKSVVADTFKMAIKCDRSPIAGIQFNNRDLAFAYERAHRKIPKFLQKFLKEKGHDDFKKH